MLNYMRAELYKVMRRKYLYIFLGCVLALETALTLMIILPDYGANQVTFAKGISMLGMLMSMGLFAGLVVCDMVFSEQYKHNTLKNEVSFGLSRSRIYLGKLAVEAVVAVALCVVMLGYYIGLCYVIMPHSSADGEIFREVLILVASALPLWLGSLCLSHMFMTLIKSSTAASFAAVGILMLLPQGLHLMGYFVSEGFRVVYSLMLSTHFGDAYTLEAFQTPVAVTAIGLGWSAVTTAIGLAAFRKKDIS